MGYFGYIMPMGGYNYYSGFSPFLYGGNYNNAYSYRPYKYERLDLNSFKFKNNTINRNKPVGTYNSTKTPNMIKPQEKNTVNKNKNVKNGTRRPRAEIKLGKDFLEAVKGVAERVQCDYRDLLAVMYAESGLNPAVVNKNGGATGLIQFMPKTAEAYGTSVKELKNMSAIEQLTYVEEFLRRSKKLAGFKPDEYLSGGDLYALVFLPARAKREILCVKGEAYYNSNYRTDLNKNGKIEKFELQQRIESKRVDESIFA